MMPTVQLSIGDGDYAASVREALSRTCAWHVKSVERPDPSCKDVLVLDQQALECLPLPLANPGRVVLVTEMEPRLLAEAWEAGIVSVVSHQDPINTVLLAIMAAGLRAVSPTPRVSNAPIPPQNRTFGSKRCKIQ